MNHRDEKKTDEIAQPPMDISYPRQTSSAQYSGMRGAKPLTAAEFAHAMNAQADHSCGRGPQELEWRY